MVTMSQKLSLTQIPQAVPWVLTPGIVASFAMDDKGATAIEYGLMASGIAITLNLGNSGDRDQRRGRL